MTAQPRNVTEAPPKGGGAPSQRRISAAMKRAIRNRLYEGMTIAEAVGEAGLSEQAWFSNMKKPHVLEFFETLKAQYINEIDRLKDRHRARALEVAQDLMENAKSESVKMRAVEFFAGEARGGSNIAVQVNVDRVGYDYVRPGVQVVEVKDKEPWSPPSLPDSVSDAEGTKPQGNKGD